MIRRIWRKLKRTRREILDKAAAKTAAKQAYEQEHAFERSIEQRFLQRKRQNKTLLNTTEQRDFELIASLTSYGDRIATAHIAIQSIFAQDSLPDRVILFLGDEAANDHKIGPELRELQKYGLEIARRPDLGPHTKYFYAMQENPDAVIITFDDDILYDFEVISSLLNSYRQYPGAVSARRMHRMLKSGSDLAPYANWGWDVHDQYTPAMDLFVTAVAGALYPPHCMNSALFDVQGIKDLCLYADDVWLKAMQILQGTPAVFVNGPAIVYIDGTQEVSLYHTNLLGGQNDKYIKQVENHFGIAFVDYATAEASTT